MRGPWSRSPAGSAPASRWRWPIATTPDGRDAVRGVAAPQPAVGVPTQRVGDVAEPEQLAHPLAGSAQDRPGHELGARGGPAGRGVALHRPAAHAAARAACHWRGRVGEGRAGGGVGERQASRVADDQADREQRAPSSQRPGRDGPHGRQHERGSAVVRSRRPAHAVGISRERVPLVVIQRHPRHPASDRVKHPGASHRINGAAVMKPVHRGTLAARRRSSGIRPGPSRRSRHSGRAWGGTRL